MKQISFCITCMNRLKHLQETLEKNILDNFLVDEVEFVVLDYNSQDGTFSDISLTALVISHFEE